MKKKTSKTPEIQRPESQSVSSETPGRKVTVFMTGKDIDNTEKIIDVIQRQKYRTTYTETVRIALRITSALANDDLIRSMLLTVRAEDGRRKQI